MIICEDITKKYSERVILNSLSFTFPDTGLFLLLGESGSGKTTFLNILSGMLPFDAGAVRLDGELYRGQVDSRLTGERVEYITQDSYFVDYLSVLDNLRLIVNDEERIRGLLAQYKLEKVAEQFPTTLSGGERQRVAILRAVLGGKAILLLDEPTASLDGDNKQAVFELLTELKKDALILCASHDREALKYADHTITFSKSGQVSAKPLPAPESADAPLRKPAVQSTPTADPGPLLRKWFRSKYRSRKTSALFFVFLVLALVICIFADTPENKEAATLSNVYGINMLRIRTYGAADKGELLRDPGLVEAVLEYGYSCPDGNEDLPPEVIMRPVPSYELNLYTLPFSAEAFRLSDRLLYGHYFTSWNEIILSREMAMSLSPDDPGSLVGKTLSVNVYELGMTEFTIAGVFDTFTNVEKKYLRSMDITIADDDSYDPRNYESLYFVNSAFTAQYEEDPTFYLGSSRQRGYTLFFKSYTAMNSFYNKYRNVDFAGISIEYTGGYLGLKDSFQLLFWTMLPAAVFLAVFATLFYAALRKIEVLHNAGFIAVFAYSGYDKAKIVRRFIRLNILDLLKTLLLAAAVAVAVTTGINWANLRFKWVDIQIFSYNPWILSSFLALIAVLAAVFTTVMYRRIRVKSWYEILVDSRDLI